MSATRLSFSYPTELKEKIKEIANSETRNISQMVQIFIMEGIERRSKEEKNKKLKLKRKEN